MTARLLEVRLHTLANPRSNWAIQHLLDHLNAAAFTYPGTNLRLTSYVEIPMDEAHVDGKLVTAPAWPAHPAWLAEFLRVLGTKIEP